MIKNFVLDTNVLLHVAFGSEGNSLLPAELATNIL